MKVLHTADWHLGQIFYDNERTTEHQKFLEWLVRAIVENDIDVLLVSGDVFDVSNPSVVAVKLFYTFLKDVAKARPHLQIIIIAGNHDSPSRLEAPRPLLEFFNVNIIGIIERDANGNPDYEKLVIPVRDREGEIKAWCMGIPFLRNGDYPIIPGSAEPYSEGVSALYKAVYDFAKSKIQPGQALLAMGHLHTSGAEISQVDKSERLIMGGVELIPVSAFCEDIAYVALGHIHKPQRIGGRENVRYAGSPLPMSFSEVSYKHQVVLFDIEGEAVKNIRPLYIPVTVRLIKVPEKHKPLNDVLNELYLLEEVDANSDPELAPYMQVRVLLDSPEPSLKYKVDAAIQNKAVRFALFDIKYPEGSVRENKTVSVEEFNQLAPVDVFKDIYRAKYNADIPQELLKLFNGVVQEVNEKES